uniref:Uncharacterized protein n=1 Tax=Arundo donax TaxID=35708 RepID=A0A0A9GK05_ARUDO
MGTNWMMSRVAILPVELSSRLPLSASRISICVKSAFPTPTMRIDSGKSDALTMQSFVS